MKSASSFSCASVRCVFKHFLKMLKESVFLTSSGISVYIWIKQAASCSKRFIPLTCFRAFYSYGYKLKLYVQKIDEIMRKFVRRKTLPPPTSSNESNHSYELRNRQPPGPQTPALPSYNISSVKLHLLENPECAEHYDDNCFTILAESRSKFHLSVLESVFINDRKPFLCRQKDFIYSLKLFRNVRY